MTLYVIRVYISNSMKTKVLITAGPTRAYLDDVRYISNFSSGALGYLVCKELVRQGVDVYAVVGPTAQPFAELKLKKLVQIETNEQMMKSVLQICKNTKPDWAVFSAAVLDFVPAKKASGKVSSKNKSWNIALKATPKIIDVVKKRYPKIKRVGFKLEWEKLRGETLRHFAAKIIEARRLELLIVNFLREVETKNHRAVLFDKDLNVTELGTKQGIAKSLVLHILE